MGKTARENFIIDADTVKVFRDLATAKGITKSELFRQMVQKEASENEPLLKKWREVEDLRNK